MDGTTLYRIALGDEARPDPWQLALATEAWPTVLVAPTGSGKAAAVTLGRAAHRLRGPEATPRRLVWCLPMPTLVERTAVSIRHGVAGLATQSDDAGRVPRPEDVYVLMGGMQANRWLDCPERLAILVGTQGMLLSRALMHGYASPRALWPMEFALQHEDTQWVFDEVQPIGARPANSAHLEPSGGSKPIALDATTAPWALRPAACGPPPEIHLSRTAPTQVAAGNELTARCAAGRPTTAASPRALMAPTASVRFCRRRHSPPQLTPAPAMHVRSVSPTERRERASANGPKTPPTCSRPGIPKENACPH